MFKYRNVVFLLLLLGVCRFCKKDFKVVARHSWRCKSRIQGQSTEQLNDNVNTQQNNATIVENTGVQPNTKAILCSCGKPCKGLRGLKAHQRSCRTIKSLNDDILKDLEENYDETISLPDEANLERVLNENPSLKPGVKLPKSETDWKTANSFFHLNLPVEAINKDTLNDSAEIFGNMIYDYFAKNFGTTKKSQEINKPWRRSILRSATIL